MIPSGNNKGILILPRNVGLKSMPAVICPITFGIPNLLTKFPSILADITMIAKLIMKEEILASILWPVSFI
ncbi:hypothetical protein BOFE_04140 [Candidatus Borrelia fainii]|uniref:Variable large protein n=1 Tax=Candidatus Borrelia fainii TaxID=2518322 RepID=A0ABN6UR90_9SPIR|nr:hypothetical protein BOFE_04140 [Candidatus Borrelia fainii]